MMLTTAILLSTLLAGLPGADLTDGGLDHIFDDRVIRSYAVTLPEADWQWLQDNAREEQYVRADLQVDGAAYDSIGIRFKGGLGTLRRCITDDGRLRCPKLSLKIRFDEYDPQQRFQGVRRLNFHSMTADPSLMREAISYGLFRAAGVFAPRAHYAQLTINGSPQGLFALVEQIDGRFARSRFDDGGGGNLYKEVWPEHLAPGPYLDSLQTNRQEEPSADRIVRFAEALTSASDESFVPTLESWTNIDALMRYLALDRLVDQLDGVLSWYCTPAGCANHNYYWYEESLRDRLWLIPWDLDRTFNEPKGKLPEWNAPPGNCSRSRVGRRHYPVHPGCDSLTRRLATLTWDKYVAATREVLATSFRVEAIHAHIDSLQALLEDTVASDPHGRSVSDWHQQVERLKELVTARHAYISALIGD